MSFKIINPGYGALIGSGFTTVNSYTFNPQNGIAFYGNTEEDFHTEKGLVIPAIGTAGTFYFKFDVYVPARRTEWTVRIVHGSGTTGKYTGFILDYSDDYGYDFFDAGFIGEYGGIAYVDISENLEDWLNFGAVNTVWGFFNLSDEEDSCKVILNGKTLIEETGKSFPSAAKTVIQFYVTSNSPISNLIISDEYIDPREVIVELGASAVDTTMTIDGAQYKAIEGDAYVLQTPDISNARGLFGNSGKILGLAAIAAPAYTTGDDVTSLKCRTVDGETVTDYSAQNLSSDTSAMLAEYLPVSSDMTVASLANFKIGWVTL